MLLFLTRRLLLAIPILFGVSFLVFGMIHLAPGDPARAILGPIATPESLDKLRRELHLYDPVYKQYSIWLWSALHGDLGRSIRLGRPVTTEVRHKFAASGLLAAASFLIAVILGIVAGVLAASRRGRALDRAILVIVVLGISLPSFYLGMLLIIAFALKLGWLPMGGMYSIEGTGAAADIARHLVLPAIALAGAPLTVIARMTRSSLLEVVREDYIRTARAKGLPERRVFFKHALKNAFIPVIHLLGLEVGFLLSAAALVEVVFAWPGLGQLMVQSVLTRDLPLTQGCVLMIAISYILVNIIADLVHALTDPRVRME